MSTISEGRQRIDFDQSWRVLKWDENGEFDGSLSAALSSLPGEGVKAADVVGVREVPSRPMTVLVAELKDFANPAIPPHQRAQAAEKAESATLNRDIVRKVIDTLAGATFSHDANDQRCQELSGWRPALARPSTEIFILVCIEAHEPLIATVLTKDLQRRLRWLGPHATVLVTSSSTPFAANGITYRV